MTKKKHVSMAIPLLFPFTRSCAHIQISMMSSTLFKTVCSLLLLLCTTAVKLQPSCATSLKHIGGLGVMVLLERFLFTAVHGRRAVTDRMGILVMGGKLSFFLWQDFSIWEINQTEKPTGQKEVVECITINETKLCYSLIFYYIFQKGRQRRDQPGGKKQHIFFIYLTLKMRDVFNLPKRKEEPFST